VGSIINQISLTAIGGDSSAAGGGQGGLIQIATGTVGGGNLSTVRSVTNSAPINASGGAATAGGGQVAGDGGTIDMYDQILVSNSGLLTTNGGNGGATNTGGQGGGVDLSSDNTVINTASIVANGGSGLNGNPGGLIHLTSQATTSKGNLSANGGNGIVVSGTLGGSGGFIEINSIGTSSVVSGTYSVTLGSGATPGVLGTVIIDGLDVSLAGGTITF
jgi:hypothetical protein